MVVLIDGQKLARLMILHDVGCSPAQTYVVKRLDLESRVRCHLPSGVATRTAAVNPAQKLWWTQARADLALFDHLRGAAGWRHECHSLQALQMADEKIAFVAFCREPSSVFRSTRTSFGERAAGPDQWALPVVTGSRSGIRMQ